MKAPDKIFILNHEDYSDIRILNAFTEKGDDTDIEYIRKDALLEWAKTEIEFSKQVELDSEEPYEEGRQQVARLLINYLNSM